MGHLTRVSTFIGLFAVTAFSVPVLAFTGSNELVHIPSSRPQKAGYSEIGTSAIGQIVSSKPKSAQKSYLRYALTDSIEYAISVDSAWVYHSFQGTFFKYETPDRQIGHYLSIGFKDLGWEPSGTYISVPVYSQYLGYTIAMIPSNLNFHAGFGKDHSSHDGMRVFLGADQTLPFGTIMTEWDGKGFNFGFRYSFYSNYNLYVTFSPMPLADPTGVSEIVSFGISFSENVLQSLLGEWGQTKRDLTASTTKMNNRLDVFEAQNRAALDIMSVDFLQDLEKAFLENKIEHKQLKEESKSLVRVGVAHMQRGLEYYYQGQFESAKTEYEAVVKMLPQLSVGYIRLGSIYYQLKNKDKAIENWEKAQKLDPENTSLAKYITTIKTAPIPATPSEIIISPDLKFNPVSTPNAQ